MKGSTDSAPSGSVVLLVDDHEDSSAMYAAFLSMHGFVPVTAPNAEEAFALACDLRPDVVVTDVVLPGASGLDLAHQLRRDPRTTDVRVIVVTGCAFPRDAEEAHKADCDSFLVKPCLPETVAGEVRRVLLAGRPTTYEQALERIRAEYLEMPGMRLKPEQIQRLCGVDAALCRFVLDTLAEARFLCLKADGSYGRVADGHIPADAGREHHPAHRLLVPRH